MAKGPIIRNSVRELIVGVHQEHPTWRAKEIQRKVNDTLRERNPRISRDWPGVSAVQKVLAPIHAKERKLPPDPKDRPWSVLDIVQYPIPPDTLPFILRQWNIRLLRGKPLTIRHVLWTARLYYVLKESKYYALGYGDRAILFDEIYTMRERAINLIGERPKSRKDMWEYWYWDAWLYKNMTGDSELYEKAEQKIRHIG